MSWLWLILASILVGVIGFIVFVTFGPEEDETGNWLVDGLSGLGSLLRAFVCAVISIIVLWVLKLAFGMALWLAILLSPVLSFVLLVIIMLIFSLFI